MTEEKRTRKCRSSGKGVWADTRAEIIVCGWALHTVQGAALAPSGPGVTPSGRYANDDFCGICWLLVTTDWGSGGRKGSGRMCVMYRAV